jgi:myosin heavy chain 9/10/11/14
MSLEAEKRKVEDELEAERALALEKETILERSKKRESEQADEIAELQSDIDALDSQLTRAMKLQKEGEEKYNELKQAFDQAAEHLVRLESEGKIGSAREAELLAQINSINEEIATLRSELEVVSKASDEFKNLAIQREEDLSRTKERSEGLVKELEGKLEGELRTRYAYKLLDMSSTNKLPGISTKTR